MTNITQEMLKKLMKAASPEEAAELLQAEGITDAPMDAVWQQLEALRARDAQELSLDELEDVAGGATARDWWSEGCAATVEIKSNCWKTDGGCAVSNIEYSSMPNTNCPKCGAICYRRYGGDGLYFFRCRNCGGFDMMEDKIPATHGGASGSW